MVTGRRRPAEKWPSEATPRSAVCVTEPAPATALALAHSCLAGADAPRCAGDARRTILRLRHPAIFLPY